MRITEKDTRSNRNNQIEVWISREDELEIRVENWTMFFSTTEKQQLVGGLVPNIQQMMDTSFLRELGRIDGCRPHPGFRSLIIGVEELQHNWEDLEVPEGPINDLVGFLFATLPLAKAELEG